MIDLDDHSIKNDQYLVTTNAKINETSWLWHHKLRHTSIDFNLKIN